MKKHNNLRFSYSGYAFRIEDMTKQEQVILDFGKMTQKELVFTIKELIAMLDLARINLK